MRLSRSRSFIFLAFSILTIALAVRLLFFGISLKALPASADEAHGVLTAKNISRGELPLLITGSPYQFPIESYLLNPLVHFLPRNAPFRGRYIAVLTGLISLIGFLLICCRLPSFAGPGPAFCYYFFHRPIGYYGRSPTSRRITTRP